MGVDMREVLLLEVLWHMLQPVAMVDKAQRVMLQAVAMEDMDHRELALADREAGLLAVQRDMLQVVVMADMVLLDLPEHPVDMKARGHKVAPADMDLLAMVVELVVDMVVESRKRLLLQNTWIGRFQLTR